MSRPPPQISPAHKQNLADLSRAQWHGEAARRNVEAMGQELDRSFTEAQAKLDRNAEHLAKQAAWVDRYGRWVARVALLPVLVWALATVAMVVLGIWNGDIKEIHKYSKLHVARAGNPVAYWASVAYHSALAGFSSWMAVQVFRAAKIGWKNAP